MCPHTGNCSLLYCYACRAGSTGADGYHAHGLPVTGRSQDPASAHTFPQHRCSMGTLIFPGWLKNITDNVLKTFLRIRLYWLHWLRGTPTSGVTLGRANKQLIENRRKYLQTVRGRARAHTHTHTHTHNQGGISNSFDEKLRWIFFFYVSLSFYFFYLSLPLISSLPNFLAFSLCLDVLVFLPLPPTFA